MHIPTSSYHDKGVLFYSNIKYKVERKKLFDLLDKFVT